MGESSSAVRASTHQAEAADVGLRDPGWADGHLAIRDVDVLLDQRIEGGLGPRPVLDVSGPHVVRQLPLGQRPRVGPRHFLRVRALPEKDGLYLELASG